MSRNVDKIKAILKKFESYYNGSYKKITMVCDEIEKNQSLINKLEQKVENLESQQFNKWRLMMQNVDYSDEINDLEHKINNLEKEIIINQEELHRMIASERKFETYFYTVSNFLEGIKLEREELNEDEINWLKIFCEHVGLEIEILDEYIILQDELETDSNVQKVKENPNIERERNMKNEFIKKIPQINIKEANLQDLQDWVNILYNSLKDTYSEYISSEYMNDNYNIKQLQSNFLQDLSIEKSSIELYMLRINSEVVGILKIGKPIKYYSDGNNYYKDDIDDVGEIKSLHIRKDFQSKGIGSQAIAFAENRLRQLGYGESSIWVKMQNTNAINFYINRGYSKTNYINPNTKDGAPSVIMEKNLRILAKDSQINEKTI